MKHLTFVFYLVCSVLCWAAPAASDYNLNVHVSATRMARDSHSAFYQIVTVTIDAKKYELESLSYPNALLMLGDYKARLVKDEHWAGPHDSYQVYEFLFANNKKRQFVVVGQSE